MTDPIEPGMTLICIDNGPMMGSRGRIGDATNYLVEGASYTAIELFRDPEATNEEMSMVVVVAEAAPPTPLTGFNVRRFAPKGRGTSLEQFEQLLSPKQLETV